MDKKMKVGIIASVGGIAAAAGVFAGRYFTHTESNTEHMYDCIDYGKSIIKKYYTIKELGAGKYSDMAMNRFMKFHVDRYEIEGLGNLAVMATKMKMMQMCTIVITPYGVNVPMASFDLMYIMGKRKFYIEFYDLVNDRDTDGYKRVISALSDTFTDFSDLPDIPPKKGGDGWLEDCRTVLRHKQFPMKYDGRGMIMFTRSLTAYLKAAKKAGRSSDADSAAQLEKTRNYVDRIIVESGISTAMFKKKFGAEMTKDFYNRVFFGCGSER